MSQIRPPVASLAEIISLDQDAFGKLVLVLRDGSRYDQIRAVRAFPINQPDFSISLVNDDGQELVWIEDLAQCPTAIQQHLRQSLAMRDFLPVIQTVISISSVNEPCEWQVVTDRGPLTFVLNNDEDVRRLDAKRAMITDGNKVQYLVEDLNQVDAITRKYLDRYL